MTGAFDDLFRLDLDGHVRRWLATDVGPVDGDVSQWIAAAQQFAARLQADPDALTGLTDEQWCEVGQAWAALLAAAERSVGGQRNEWLLRDLHLRSWLLVRLRPRAGVALLDVEAVLDRALAAMPMSVEEAVQLASRWRELKPDEILAFREQILELRMIRRLLATVRPLAALLADHPRWSEVEEWARVAEGLP
ncbi:hypothetical protein [Streptomyces canus]|uniref:hypothetical protein n=1 Tax=Streptomyces canus TaxID=58343 RepID=UPI002DD98F62|nr:hypothetical protein [Streptomyces canus]WSD85915.1 hypothetical protein OG925_17145 [Streptomyces canus]